MALALLGLQPCVATCPPGTFSPEGGACKPCAPGSYQWASGASSCKLASPGFYVAAKQATAQEPCPAGYYQGESGGTLCTPCRRGTYNAHVGQAVCSVAGAAVPEDPLNATHFFAGYYVDREGATAPTKCPFGTQALQLGQGSCDPCPVGHFADSYLAAEVDAHGAATNATHRVYKGCEACPIGHFGGISTEAACRPCPKGTWGGHVGAVNLESCVHCSAGKYGSREGATSGEACRPCTLATVLPGFFCPLASDSSEGVPCPDKHYCAGGDAVPAAIGAGYHVAPPHRLAPCAEGSWLPASEAYNASWRDAATGLYPCRLAAPGQYVAGTGQSQPSTCEAGTFSGAPGAPACTPCPEETWSLRGEAQCYACQAEQVTGSCHAEKEEALEGENAEYRKAMNTMRQHARVAMGAAELRRAKLQQQQQQ